MKDWKYLLYVGGALLLVVAVKLTAPKQFSWVETYAHDDKNPYGTYALHQLLPGIFDGQTIRHSYRTIYELKDSLAPENNLFIVAKNFNPEREDVKSLLQHVSSGGHALISATYFSGIFSDTLRIASRDFLFNFENWEQKDTSYLKFSNPTLDTMRAYHYRRDNIHNYFNKLDTTGYTVIARNDSGKPVTVKMTFGKGYFILNSTPMAFTNIYLLSENNQEFISKTFSYLPPQSLQWTEYYHMGRMESATPLRFILTNEPLKWAYYLTVISLLVFMIFEAKRKQRVIPVIKPLANTTLEFVSTIGNLYYQKGNHKDMAEKKILFLFEQIRSQYFLNTSQIDDQFLKTLASKSGHSYENIVSLFRNIAFIQQADLISAGQLMDLNRKIELFNSRP
jgi:hypothetical protein